MNKQLPAQLAVLLEQPLPGWQAHARFQPELSFGRHRGPTPDDVRSAAVLVLLYPHDDQWHLPLMLRPSTMPHHANQVSFPGGVVERGESSSQAALREFVEELGWPADDVRLLGQLSDLYLYASNFRITPWVAVTESHPIWQPSEREVERLMEVPIAHFFDDVNFGRQEHTQRGFTFTAPCYYWKTEQIWGATSMILAELVSVLATATL